MHSMLIEKLPAVLVPADGGIKPGDKHPSKILHERVGILRRAVAAFMHVAMARVFPA